MGPFRFSRAYLDEHGLDNYGEIPEQPSSDQIRELRSIFGTWPRDSVSGFRLPVHVIKDQKEHLLAVCDLERAGFTFNSHATTNGNLLWLGMEGGDGVRIYRMDGLFYLYGASNDLGGIDIGNDGDIRFLIDTGAQASLAMDTLSSSIADQITPEVIPTAAGSGQLIQLKSGYMNLRYTPGGGTLRGIGSSLQSASAMAAFHGPKRGDSGGAAAEGGVNYLGARIAERYPPGLRQQANPGADGIQRRDALARYLSYMYVKSLGDYRRTQPS